MKLLILSLIIAAGFAFTMLASPEPACAGNCGFKPFTPFVPFGCKDLYARCVCDSKGQNCHWEWVCVN